MRVEQLIDTQTKTQLQHLISSKPKRRRKRKRKQPEAAVTVTKSVRKIYTDKEMRTLKSLMGQDRYTPRHARAGRVIK